MHKFRRGRSIGLERFRGLDGQERRESRQWVAASATGTVDPGGPPARAAVTRMQKRTPNARTCRVACLFLPVAQTGTLTLGRHTPDCGPGYD